MIDGEKLIDTNVLVHGYVLLNANKQASARDIILPIWQEGGGLTTTQNLCEFFTVATRKVKTPMPIDRAESVVKEILRSAKWRVIDRSEGSVLHAIELVKLHHVPFWDALIAACMLEHGVHAITTENERDFKKVPGITVINPFKPGAEH